MVLIWVLLIFVILSASYSLYLRNKQGKLPPGPLSLPIFGNLLNLGLESHRNVLAMKKRYGNIIRIDLGPKRSVFLNDYGLIKEAFSKLALSGRPPFEHYSLNKGILTSSGQNWMEQRRLCFSYIQSGFRNGVPIESLILHEANELVEHLKENCGRPVSTLDVFNVPIINILWGIAAGERYKLTDPKILKVMEHLKEFVSNAAIQGLFIFFFKWAKMFPEMSGLNHHKNSLNHVLDYIKDIIDDHKKTYQEGIQRDLIDCYLAKIGITTDEKSSFFGKTGEENLIMSLSDIFFAGGETSATTLRWLVFLMAHYPEKQEKFCNVITDHMQDRTQPSLKDRQILPFVEAVIMEVMRFSSTLPIGVLHEATEDFEFHGYLIPKGTMVIANQYGVMHDPEVWGDPENFRPERFLNENETEVIRHPALIPFSTGRRVCPGEFLARDELFLFATKLFQSFKVSFDPSVPNPPIKHFVGSVLSPIEHKILFSKRFV